MAGVGRIAGAIHGFENGGSTDATTCGAGSASDLLPERGSSLYHSPLGGQAPVPLVVQVRLISPFSVRSILNMFFVGTDSDSTV